MFDSHSRLQCCPPHFYKLISIFYLQLSGAPTSIPWNKVSTTVTMVGWGCRWWCWNEKEAEVFRPRLTSQVCQLLAQFLISVRTRQLNQLLLCCLFVSCVLFFPFMRKAKLRVGYYTDWIHTLVPFSVNKVVLSITLLMFDEFQALETYRFYFYFFYFIAFCICSYIFFISTTINLYFRYCCSSQTITGIFTGFPFILTGSILRLSVVVSHCYTSHCILLNKSFDIELM